MRCRTLPEASYRFRRQLLEALDRFTPSERFFYVDEDTVAVVCPVCGEALGVRFAAFAARAELECLIHGCPEAEILTAL
ncbi:MAG: hypothetical protein ACRDK7_01445 [Solirubrobacteraceae bacterium]